MRSEPVVLEEHVAAAEAEFRLLIPPDLDYFVGHFPDAPVLAGVVQLKWAIEAARRHLGASGTVIGMENLKFQRVLVPGAVVTLSLQWMAHDSKLHFAYAANGARFSSGRIKFRSTA